MGQGQKQVGQFSFFLGILTVSTSSFRHNNRKADNNNKLDNFFFLYKPFNNGLIFRGGGWGGDGEDRWKNKKYWEKEAALMTALWLAIG